MLEPSPRYAGAGGTGGASAGSALQIDTGGGHHNHLETAVDLSRKAAGKSPASADNGAPAGQTDLDAEQEDSEDEAPLDLKVRPRTGSCSSSIGGGGPATPLQISDIQRAEQTMPNLQQRAEILRIAEAMHSTNPPPPSLPLPTNVRSDSQERELPSDSACSLCGADTQSSDFKPAEHGENLCGRGTISCSLCSKTFTLWSHYEAHKKCHQKLKQRQYPCQSCGKVFTSASNRNMHQRIHKGVRPFQCTPCGVFFRQKAHLQKHQKTQGHVQATEIYEKKKRDGLLPASNSSEAAANGGGGSAASTEEAMKHGVLSALGLQQRRPDSVKSVDSMSSNTNSSTASHGLNLLATVTAATADSTQSLTSLTADDVSADSSLSPSSTGSGGGHISRSKSSPKRKQAKPSQLLINEATVSTSEDKLNGLIDYNDLTHGYDCNQCSFSSHDLAVIKDHVKDEHFATDIATDGKGGGKLKCSECQITFSKEFNLRIHSRKHETSSHFLPCDHCEQVFKVPNKLIKHMEGVHAVCPTCGEKQEDKASLLRHLEDAHNDSSRVGKGFHSGLMQFSPLMNLHSSPNRSNGQTTNAGPASTSTPNNAASSLEKRRKVDSLAEVIRQKQEMKNNNVTSLSLKSPLSPSSTSPSLSRKSPRKSEVPSVMRSLSGGPPLPPGISPALSEAISASFLHLQPQPLSELRRGSLQEQSHHHHSLLHHHHKSENNNVLVSMANGMAKLPPSIRLPTKPVSGLSPPASPPPTRHHGLIPQHPLPPHEIRGEVSVTIMRDNNESDPESDNEEETGLDLSMSKRRRNSDEDADVVSTSRTSLVPDHPSPLSTDFYKRLAPGLGGAPIGAPGFPGAPGQIPGFPFPFPLPSVTPGGADPAHAELLLRLARAPPAPEIKAPTTSPYNVLSAMLGHHNPYPTVFPGMPPVFPSGGPSATSAAAALASIKAESAKSAAVAAAAVAAAEIAEDNKSEVGSVSSRPGRDRSHSANKPFHCSLCRKEFGHLSSLESHMDHMHSGDSKHACESCGKSFSSKSNLTAHRKIHSGERPFECVVCHKRFRQKAHLQKHETTHSSATPYKCSVCDKAFGHISNLNTHMATHSNVRPYHCADCGKSYKDSASFKRHRLGHTGERPYACDICSESFIDSKGLRRHHDLSHPNEPRLNPLLGGGGPGDPDEEELDDDEDAAAAASSASTSAYSSFESGRSAAGANLSSLSSEANDSGVVEREKSDEEEEEIEVEKEMEEEEDDDEEAAGSS